MKKVLWIVFALVLVVGSMFLATQNRTSKTEHKLTNNAKIYDVRTAEEFAQGHAKNAILLPLADIENGKLPDVDKNAEIAVYCRSGNRSNQAKKLLEKAGFSTVRDLGGLGNLKQYGLETVK